MGINVRRPRRPLTETRVMRTSAKTSNDQWVRSPLEPKGRGESSKRPTETGTTKLFSQRSRVQRKATTVPSSALPRRGTDSSTVVNATAAADANMEPPLETTTYHDGELAVQARMGVSDTAKFRSAHQKTCLPKPAQDFYAELPFVVISAQDADGRMWTSMVASRDGTPCLSDLSSKSFVLRAGSLSASDALHGALVPGTAVGLIGINFSTRARTRTNCTVESVASNGDVRLKVEICASHCPQYITQRTYEPSIKGNGTATESPMEISSEHVALAAAAQPTTISSRLTLDDPEIRPLIDEADTFFIGSAYGRRAGDSDARHGADASNRCGNPGFVRVTGPNTLSFDNYNGNQMYSTLGNITKDPRVGLTFFDWSTGDLLQLSGIASIEFTPAAEQQDKGRSIGERVMQVVHIRVDSVVRVAQGLPGTWKKARSRPLVISKKVDESEGVVSFYLEAPPSAPSLSPFSAGQHMPVLINGLNRSYSLSGNPSCAESFYRISVKNIGQASSVLHDLKVGEMVECLPPAGSFGPASLQASDNSEAVDGVVLVAAGVGVTPMVSMAYAANKPTAVVHAVRDSKQWPFRDEFKNISTQSSVPIELRVFLSRPQEEDLSLVAESEKKREREIDWKVAARRVKVEDLLKVAEDLGASKPLFCFCGPLPFSAPLMAALEDAGIPAANIKSESFG